MSSLDQNFDVELSEWLKEYETYGYFPRIHSSWQSLSEFPLDESVSETDIPNIPYYIPADKSCKLFSLDEEFQQTFSSYNFDTLNNIPQKLLRVVNQYEGNEHIGTIFAGCEMKNVQLKKCKTYLFKNLKLLSTYGIVCKTVWFTQDIVEEAGNDSVAYLHQGLKLWVGCANMSKSKEFVATSTSASSLLRLLKNPADNSLRYHILKSGECIIQPSLIAHSVITFHYKNEMSLITGWEAANLLDFDRPKRVLNYFGLGKRKNEWFDVFCKGGELGLQSYMNKLCDCELKTHYNALVYAGYDFTRISVTIPARKKTLKQKQRENVASNSRKM